MSSPHRPRFPVATGHDRTATANAAETLLDRLRQAQLEVEPVDAETALIAGRFEINTATTYWKDRPSGRQGYGAQNLIEAARKVVNKDEGRDAE